MKNGYSLVELMIVVAIIGILALMALPAYQSYTLRIKITEIYSVLQYNHRLFISEYLIDKTDWQGDGYTNSMHDTKPFLVTSFDIRDWNGDLSSTISSYASITSTNFASSSVWLFTSSFFDLPQQQNTTMSFDVIPIIDESMILSVDDSPSSVLPGFKLIKINDYDHFEPKTIRWVCGYDSYNLILAKNYESVQQIMLSTPKHCRNIFQKSSFAP